MLPLFNTLFASILTLAVLLVLLCAPFALAWFVFSIARSLSRIADSLELARPREIVGLHTSAHLDAFAAPPAAPRVSNSMFAR